MAGTSVCACPYGFGTTSVNVVEKRQVSAAIIAGLENRPVRGYDNLLQCLSQKVRNGITENILSML